MITTMGIYLAYFRYSILGRSLNFTAILIGYFKSLIYLLDKSDLYSTNINIKKVPADSIIKLIISKHKEFSKIFLLDNSNLQGKVIEYLFENSLGIAVLLYSLHFDTY